jgi:hypothetical protein
VSLNFGNEPQTARVPPELSGARIVLSSNLDREGDEVRDALRLRANEGVVMSAAAARG